jgi:hypothetical protein
MRHIPRHSIPNSLSIRLDVGTEINLLSNEVTAVYLWGKGPPNQTKFILAQNPEGEVFFYDPYKKDSNNMRIMNNAVECNIDITEPGEYTFWVEILYNNEKIIGDSCDAYFS